MAELKRVKLMRGNEASRLSVTPAQGEQIMTTNELKLYLGDGNKAGGFIVSADNTIAVWPDQTDATKKLSLAWWIAHFNGEEATIRIPRGTHKVLDDMTIPENICLKFDKGAIIEVADTKTLTINGAIEAGLWQIFSGLGDIAGEAKVEASYPEWFGAIGNNIVDDSEAVSKWASVWSCVKKANSAAIYKCQKEVKFTGSVVVDGCNATFDFTDAPEVNFTAQACFLFEGGELVEMPALGADVTAMSKVINVVTEPDLDQSDIVVLYDSANGSFNKARDYYHSGEYGKVFSVAPGTSGYDITLTDLTYAGYAANSTVKLYKMNNPVTATIRNLHIKSTLNGNISCLRIVRGYQCLIDNLIAEQSSYCCVSLAQCFESSIINSHASKLAPDISGTSYGFGVGNSQRITISNCYAVAIRHAIATGGGEGIGCVPNRAIKYTHNTLITTGASAALDAHGNTEYYDFSHNTLKGGVTMGGNNGVVSNNQIDGSFNNGIGIYFSECIGSNFTIADNIYTTDKNPPLNRGLFIDYAGNSYVFVNGQTNNGGTLFIKGNVVKWGNSSTPTSSNGCINIRNRVAAENHFVIIIENNSFQAPTSLGASVSSGTISIDNAVAVSQIIVQNNTMTGSGIDIRGAIKAFVKNNVILNCNNIGISVSKTLTFDRGDVMIEDNYINTTRIGGIEVVGLTDSVYYDVRVARNTVKNNCQEATGSSATNSPLFLNYVDTGYIYDNDLGGESAPAQERQAVYLNMAILYEKNNKYRGPGYVHIDSTVGTKYGQTQAAIADETSEVTVAKFNSVLAALRKHQIILP